MRFLVFLLVLWTVPAFANPLDVVITGSEATITYDEPTTNADGSPLNDLAETVIYHNFGGPRVEAARVPASSPQGGGTITHVIILPIPVGADVQVEFWATAVDDALNPNESADSVKVTKDFDTLAPGPPQ